MSLNPHTSTRAVVRRCLAAPRDRVFGAWTAAEHLKRWFFPTVSSEAIPHVEVELRVGGGYHISMVSPNGDLLAKVGGVYQEIQAPEKLVFTWRWEIPQADMSETLVTVELYEIAEGTEVVITHERVLEAITPEDRLIGWRCCLDRLTAVVEEVASDRMMMAVGDLCR